MRIIAHLDMDSFFASIEARENPQFTGLGIVVGADPKAGLGRGVVSTANYQARKYGIHSAMPISTAWRLSQIAIKNGHPKTVFLPVNMAYYARVSEKIMKIIVTLLNGYTVGKQSSPIEQTSIDEAYLDLSFCADFPAGPASAMQLINKLKSEIKSREKLTAKVGIGPNKLIAKMASSKCKPDGLLVIYPELVEKFLDPLPVGDIPGIGPKSEEFFHRKNIYKISELRQITKNQLQSWMGRRGEDIYQKARGIDDAPVTPVREVKSVSEQETFEKDTISAAFILEKLNRLSDRVMERMKNEGIARFKTVSITVRFADFTTKTRAHTLLDFTESGAVFKREVIKLSLPFLDRRGNPQMKKIRLIGAGIENFKETVVSQESLL